MRNSAGIRTRLSTTSCAPGAPAAWPGVAPGRIGPPQVTAPAFAVPGDTFAFWTERLAAHGVAIEPAVTRFREEALRFADPDGLPVEIAATVEHAGQIPTGGPVPAEYAIRGFYSATTLRR